MKLLIVAGHKINKDDVQAVINQIDLPDRVVLSGGKFDGIISKWAKNHSLPIDKILAHTRYHREYAVFIRNQRLAEYADEVLIIWNETSSALNHLLSRFRAVEKPVTIYYVKNQRATRLSWRASSSSAPERQVVPLCTVGATHVVPSS